MSDQSGDFIANLLTNLTKNGFPGKKVALPLDKLYESAHGKGVNLNKILTFLHDEKNIAHEKSSSKIIFAPKSVPESAAISADGLPGFDNMEGLIKLGQQMFGAKFDANSLNQGDLDFAELTKKARDLIAGMNPEQMANLQQMAAGLSEDQNNEMMQQVKDLAKK